MISGSTDAPHRATADHPVQADRARTAQTMQERRPQQASRHSQPERNRVLSDILDAFTTLADTTPELTERQRDTLRRLAAVVGRAPQIEEAKLVVRERYGVTGVEAFAMIRQLSQRQNRKLRDVAADILARQH